MDVEVQLYDLPSRLAAKDKGRLKFARMASPRVYLILTRTWEEEVQGNRHLSLRVEDLAGCGARPEGQPDYTSVLALPRRQGFGSREKKESASAGQQEHVARLIGSR